MPASILGTSWPRSLNQVVERLRDRRPSSLLAALRPAPQPAKPELPGLQGEALARHHLALAVDALRKPGSSKPELFRTLRLLLNGFEQATGRPEFTSPVANEQLALPALSRRTRLLSRAFESANSLAAWRKASDRSLGESRVS